MMMMAPYFEKTVVLITIKTIKKDGSMKIGKIATCSPKKAFNTLKIFLSIGILLAAISKFFPGEKVFETSTKVEWFVYQSYSSQCSSTAFIPSEVCKFVNFIILPKLRGFDESLKLPDPCYSKGDTPEKFCRFVIYEPSMNLFSIETVYQFLDELFGFIRRIRNREIAVGVILRLKAFHFSSENARILFHFLVLHNLPSHGIVVLFDDYKYHPDPTIYGKGAMVNFDVPALSLTSISSFSERCSRWWVSRKHDTLCFPQPFDDSPKESIFPLLITGLGGTGTHFVTLELQKLRFDLAHEGIGSDGAVSWFYAVNDRFLETFYPFGRISESSFPRPFFFPRFQRIIHVVREPFSHISAFTSHSNKTYRFAHQSLTKLIAMGLFESEEGLGKEQLGQMLLAAHQKQRSCLRGESCHLQFATIAWVYWNRFVASFADKTFRIEEHGELIDYVCEYLWTDYHYYKTQERYWSATGQRNCKSVRERFLSLHAMTAVYLSFRQQPHEKSSNHRVHLQYSQRELDAVVDPRILRELRKDRERWGYG